MSNFIRTSWLLDGRVLSLLVFVGMLLSCNSDTEDPSPPIYDNLQEYVDLHSSLERDDLIACAGGTTTSFLGDSINPVSVFFYPEEGAKDFKYFETNSVAVDKSDLSQYEEKSFALTDLFNGAMKKYDHPPLSEEKWGIVTFKTEGKLHLCNPIHLKSNVAPTLDISNLVEVQNNGTEPRFDWTAEEEPNNVIYFSIVSDDEDYLLSGIYTVDKFWRFYDLSNVVLNITSDPSPTLQANSTYRYTLMGVSEDNWVYTFAVKDFETE